MCGTWLVRVALAYGDIYVRLSASPAEIWANAGDEVTVTFSGTIVDDAYDAEAYDRKWYWSFSDNNLHLLRRNVFHGQGKTPSWTTTVVLPASSESYTTSMSVSLSAYVESYTKSGQLVSTEMAAYGDGSCLIHIRGKATSTPDPTPDPTPPLPPVTPLPSPVPPVPGPSPTAPPPPVPPVPLPSPIPPVPEPSPIPKPSPPPTPTPRPPSTHWSPVDKEIGYDRVGETWVANGNLIAPVDQRFNSVLPTQNRIVAAGAEVRCEIEAAQDWDTRTVTTPATETTPAQVSTSYEMDWPLTYKWTADKGTFKGAVNGLSAVWVAPDDITATTEVTIKCTIDDPPGARVISPETGSRDDAPTVRTAKVKVMLPEVKFTGSELVNGTLRACAGGIDDHGQSDFQYRAHTRRIDVEVTLNGYPLYDAKFSLRFLDNKGHAYGDGRTRKVARLHKTNEPFDAAHPWKDALDLRTNDKSQVSVWVLSSDVINKPRLQAILKPVAAPREPLKLGEIACDFAAALSIRRFGLPDYPDDEDTGWIFTSEDLFAKKGDTTPAKVYLKFQIDSGVNIDTHYFDQEGVARKPLDDDGNWKVVNGHNLRLRIVQITRLDGESVAPNEFADYATLVTGSEKQPVDFVDLTTANGAAQTTLKAGPLVQQAESVTLDAVDLSVYQS